MKIGGFVLGTVCGLVGGIAGCAKANKQFGYPVNWFIVKRNALNDLVRKVLGSGYSVERYTGFSAEWSKAREELKNYVEKQKEDEKGETVHCIMDILGAEGIFDKGHTIVAKLLDECSEFRRGTCGLGSEYMADEYDIHGETFYVYYLRGGIDDPGYISTVEKRPVTVNYCGTFVTRTKLDILEGKNCYELGEADWGLTGEWITVDSFLSDEQWRQR